MKLPALHHVFRNLLFIAKRFPLAVLATISGTVAGMILVGKSDLFYEQHYYLSNLVLTTALMLPAFLALQLFMESIKADLKLLVVTKAALLAAFVVYFFALPQKTGLYDIIFFILVNIALHLLVAFSPFILKASENDFWDFNKALFLRILTALLYSGVLYAGLTLAMLAIENLFDINIADSTFLRLWFFMIGIFNTLFFLGGVPTPNTDNRENHRYPGGLKIFTQYVLLPLVAVYLVILYSYMIKIGVLWDWPRGWVSYLILGFSGLGILSFLLIHPLQETKENRWVGLFLKWFYFLLIPLIVLLGLAVFRRISDYGTTENRYFLVVLTGWLGGITIYFLTKKKTIKIIPISLSVLAFLAAFGPWGAVSMSRRSQLNRFEKIVRENNMLNDGQIARVKKGEISFQHQKQLSSILSFLDDRNQLLRVKPYFGHAPDSLFSKESLRDRDKVSLLTERMGIEYIPDWQTAPYESQSESLGLYANENEELDISGFDYLIPVNYYHYDDTMYTSIGAHGLFFDGSNNTLRITKANEDIGFIPLMPSLSAWNEKYTSIMSQGVPAGELAVLAQNENYRFKLFLSGIDLEKNDKSFLVYSLSGWVLIGEID